MAIDADSLIPWQATWKECPYTMTALIPCTPRLVSRILVIDTPKVSLDQPKGRCYTSSQSSIITKEMRTMAALAHNFVETREYTAVLV